MADLRATKLKTAHRDFRFRVKIEMVGRTPGHTIDQLHVGLDQAAGGNGQGQQSRSGRAPANAELDRTGK